MAFFRKPKKAKDTGRIGHAAGKGLSSQAKWDELERLVNSDAEPSETSGATADYAEDYSDESLGSSRRGLDLKAEDLRDAKPSTFASDLRVDLPDDIEFEDVTSPSPQSRPQPSIDAMMPSEHFERDTMSDPLTEPGASAQSKAQDEDYLPPHPGADRPDRADIGTMRLDVARISADIQSGEELYRRAQQRIENLTNFVERAEVDFSMLNRLEPENRRLKARNRTIQREIDSNIQKMDVLRADLEDRELRLAEKTRVYESTLGKLSVAQKSLQEYERALHNTRGSSDRNALKSERLQTSLDVERRENEVLRSRVTEIATEMEAKKTAYIEAKKVADSLAQDCSDFRQQAETAEKDADALRKSLTTAQTQNNAMKAEMISLHEDIRAFKTQSEFSIISREDEMTALQQQVSLLTKQLEIKDEILQNAARDVQDLRKVRTAQDLERERLESQIETQAYQLDQANSELLKSKQDVTDFDRRYRDVATALSVAQARRTPTQTVETPDIQPLPPKTTAKAPAKTKAKKQAPKAKAKQPKSDDELSELSSEDVNERIVDFRLGLRNDLT